MCPRRIYLPLLTVRSETISDNWKSFENLFTWKFRKFNQLSTSNGKSLMAKNKVGTRLLLNFASDVQQIYVNWLTSILPEITLLLLKANFHDNPLGETLKLHITEQPSTKFYAWSMMEIEILQRYMIDVTETYLEPSQTSMMERFCKKSRTLTFQKNLFLFASMKAL